MKRGLHDTLLVIPLLLVVILARKIPEHFAGGMPQAPGDDVLQLVLGDARRELGQTMLERADGYFHGGMEHDDCTGLEEHDDHGTHMAHPDRHADHVMTTPPASLRPLADPWQWMNRHIHAQEHRHLAATQFAELLPWIWAACRADPHNIQAYQIGAYVLVRQTGNADAGIRLLKQGIVANPGNPELAFELGENYLNRAKNAEEAERWFEKAYTDNALEKHPADVDAQILKLRTLQYLGYLARQRGDIDRLRNLLKEAMAINPAHQSVRALKALLEQVSP